ncbi:hypothetical protein MUU74_01090 [Chryseobacterium daecheongense]|uniref:hypothetical protein n=1 Tax=Chryseobacterium daecheongense TaxID=192389 RepID=UPI001FD674DA|nr:hypothetical protein [Chryseobacterium daecheongense]UOU98579.1 hypothetical protein MUU74_01090 [Chryseobacterium daecheongense]
MKKLLLICLTASFIFGAAQEKKISFAKELNYQFVGKEASRPALKMYASNSNEFLTKLDIRETPMYYYTDGLGTTVVSLALNNHLDGYLNSWMFYGMGDFYEKDDKQPFTLETQKLDTKETILGIPCSHFLLSLKDGERKDEKVKLCIDDKSPVSNFSVLNGILNQYMGKSKLKDSGLKGMILKGGPEKDYDKEYIVLASLKDTKDFVYFDHKKAMTDQQKKMDSIMLSYKKMEEEYASADSAAVAVDSVAAVADPYAYDNYYAIPDYVSEYKKAQDEDGSLAITNIPNENLWKGLPKHCKNFEKDLPEFKNKDLKKHLKNYVGQMCDMYLTQSGSHNVGIKLTLDEIRREVLYLNEVHDQLDESDQKKLKNYLKNLD